MTVAASRRGACRTSQWTEWRTALASARAAVQRKAKSRPDRWATLDDAVVYFAGYFGAGASFRKPSEREVFDVDLWEPLPCFTPSMLGNRRRRLVRMYRLRSQKVEVVIA
jgi:hypothetical protein